MHGGRACRRLTLQAEFMIFGGAVSSAVNDITTLAGRYSHRMSVNWTENGAHVCMLYSLAKNLKTLTCISHTPAAPAHLPLLATHSGCLRWPCPPLPPPACTGPGLQGGALPHRTPPDTHLRPSPVFFLVFF